MICLGYSVWLIAVLPTDLEVGTLLYKQNLGAFSGCLRKSLIIGTYSEEINILIYFE